MINPLSRRLAPFVHTKGSVPSAVSHPSVRLVGHRDDRFECRRRHLVFSLSFLCESEERLGILEVEEMRRALTPGLPERWEGRKGPFTKDVRTEEVARIFYAVNQHRDGQGGGGSTIPEFSVRHL